MRSNTPTATPRPSAPDRAAYRIGPVALDPPRRRRRHAPAAFPGRLRLAEFRSTPPPPFAVVQPRLHPGGHVARLALRVRRGHAGLGRGFDRRRLFAVLRRLLGLLLGSADPTQASRSALQEATQTSAAQSPNQSLPLESPCSETRCSLHLRAPRTCMESPDSQRVANW
jgi:hypothetical protein